MMLKQIVIFATLLVSLTTGFIIDEDATVEEAGYGSKYDIESDGIANKIMSALRRFEQRLNAFEVRFNESLETLQKTTPPTTQSYYYGRGGHNRGYSYGGYTSWTRWVPPTTSTTAMSPVEKCRQSNNFLCYNASPVCIDKSKQCNGVNDCSDGSDERFCDSKAPEFLKSNSKCPNGFAIGSSVSNKCYSFNVDKMINWIHALVDCTKRNGRLTSITSRLEQESLVRYIKSHESLNVNASFWIGATNILRNSSDGYWTSFSNPNINKQWSWIPTRLGDSTKTFAETGFSYWQDQQPDNNMGNEFCMEMWSDYDFKWNDVQCAKLRYYICEAPMNDTQ